MKKPEISRISPANPGETVQIFGENLKDCRAYIWYPPADINGAHAFAPQPLPARPAEAVELEVVATEEQVLYASIPWLEYGCFLIWVVNEAGEAGGTINRPEVWSQSLDIAMAGDHFTLFGRNYFGYDQRYFTDTTCCLQNVATGEIYIATWGAIQDLQQNMPGQNDHKSDYILPEDLPAGDYLVSMTNGTGGAWGWSEPRPLTITATRSYTEYCRLKWNAECRQNLTYPMDTVARIAIDAALGDGFTDVTKILQDAIDRIAETGGIVSLPAGRFGLTRTVAVKPGVVIKGAGMGATTLTIAEGRTLEPTGMPTMSYAKRAADGKNWSIDWLPYIERENNTPLLWLQTDAGLEDLKLEGGSGSVVMAVVGTVDDTPSDGVFFNRVHVENAINSALYKHGTDFDISYQGIITVGHTNNFTLYKCKVESSFPLMVLPAQCHNLRLIGNEFEVSPRQTGDCVYISGVYGAMITENSFWYGRRSLISQQGMYDSWVFQNRSEGVANTTNANEEYMSEYGYSAWCGNAVAVDAASISVGFPLEKARLLQRGTVGENLHEHRWFLLITEGRGLGQYRTVTGVKGDTIYLDRPWDVLPDTDTFFDLTCAAQHNMWVNNFAGIGSGVSQFSYGACIENVITAHSVMLSTGISMYAMMEHMTDDIKELGVTAFTQFTGCDCRYSGMGLCLWTNETFAIPDDRPVPHRNIVGNIVRWNSFTGGADGEFVKNQTMWTPVETPCGIQNMGDYCLMERNLLAGYEAGIHIRPASHGVMVANNRFRQNRWDILDEGSHTYILSETGTETITKKK